MFKDCARGIALAFVAMVLGLGIVAWAVSQWTSLSSRWIHAGFVAPLFGLHGGLVLASTSEESHRTRLRVVFMLASIVVCSLGNYLAFVITSRTWFVDRIALEHRDFFYQVMHPDVLPAFVERTASGHGSEQTWMMYLMVGLFAGPVAFWYSSRNN